MLEVSGWIAAARVQFAMQASGLFFAVACGSALAAPTFVEITPLPGATYISASDISGDGRVIVGSSGVTNVWGQAFRWSRSTGLQSLGQFGYAALARFEAVNADGSVIAGSGHPELYTFFGFRWTATTGAQPLGSVGSYPETWVHGINSDGSIIVGQTRGDTRAFRWTASSGGQDLGTLPTHTVSYAFGVSDDGAVAGYSTGGGRFRACWWTPSGQIQDLGLPSGVRDTFGLCISADGTTIGGNLVLLPNGTRPMLWTVDGGVENLGLPPGTVIGQVLDLSGDGRVAVGSVGIDFLTSGRRAFLWTREMGITRLDAYLELQGVDSAGLILNEVTGISLDGSAIAGWGTRDGQYRAWVVQGLNLLNACDADLDNDGNFQNGTTRDGAVTVEDLLYFLAAFEAGDGAADLANTLGIGHADGAVTIDDLLHFLTRFELGC